MGALACELYRPPRAAIVVTIAVLALTLLLKMPVEVVLSPPGLSYSGGIPPRTVFFTWDQVVDVRKRYEPAALGAGPVRRPPSAGTR